MNIHEAYAEVFEDKNIIPYIAKSLRIKMPQTIISRIAGLFYNDSGLRIDKRKAMESVLAYPMLFCKPSVVACGGKGAFILKTESLRSDADFDVFLNKLGLDFVIQQVIICEETIRCIYPNAVNTFRVTTYRWHDEFFVMPVAMRIGIGQSIVDNVSAGGLFVAVNDDGIIYKNAMSLSNHKYTEHPDTKVPFIGHKINNFKGVIDAALSLHSKLPMIGVIGWDFTIDEYGSPVLIEANIRNASFRLGQIAHGIPAFGNRTAEVLQWIQKIKHTPFSKRRDHTFGN